MSCSLLPKMLYILFLLQTISHPSSCPLVRLPNRYCYSEDFLIMPVELGVSSLLTNCCFLSLLCCHWYCPHMITEETETQRDYNKMAPSQNMRYSQAVTTGWSSSRGLIVYISWYGVFCTIFFWLKEIKWM